MVNWNSLNPFSKREEHSANSLLTYKILTFASWLLVHIVNIHYAWNAPNGKGRSSTIWGQNAQHPTAFALNPTIVDIYWVVVLFTQVAYMVHLYHGSHKAAAANVGAHFILNNLLMFGFVLLWVHGRRFFWVGELLMIVNFFNLTSLYFRHNTTPLLVHVPVVVGPLAWTFVALFWCGAAVVDSNALPARILANIAVWGWLVYGGFFLMVYKDWTMGLAMSILSASLGVHQFFLKLPLLQLQWIFAFVSMGVLFIVSLMFAVPGVFGKDNSFFTRGRNSDSERQPLLNDTN